MPTESSRLRRGIGPRDRRLIVAAACVSAVSAPAALLAGGGAARPASCTTHDRAGFMGAETVTVCPGGDNRRKELTLSPATFTLETPMSRLTNAVSKPVFAFVARRPR
jgi:hypothetical protein